MKNKEVIFQSLDLIEKNLKSDMTVYAVSQKFGFSYFYFSRLFKGITGFNPKTYILNRKISDSVNDIVNTEKKIIEIALDYGFSTPESFSRAFQKIIGLNPSKLRKKNSFDKNRLFLPLTKEKIKHAEKMSNSGPELVEMGPLYLVGISLYSELHWKNDLSDPWKLLIKNITAIPSRLIPEKYYQVQYWFPDQDAGSFFFFLGVEVVDFGEIPMQLSAKMLPHMKFLKFLHKGLSNTVGHTYQYIYEQWLPETEFKLPYFFNFEFYGEQFKGPYNEESISEIYIPVEK